MRLHRAKLILVLLALCVTSTSIGHADDKEKEFTPDDFQTIKKNLPEDKVVETLGPPIETFDIKLMGQSSRRCYWVSKEKYYGVILRDGKVQSTTVFAEKKDYDSDRSLMKRLADKNRN